MYTLASVVNGIVPFLLLPLLTRYLDPKAYGTIAIFLFSITFSGAFTGLSVHGAVNLKYFKTDKESFSVFVGNCFFILIFSSILISLIALFFLDKIYEFSGLSKRWVFLAIAISAFQFVNNIRVIIWQNQGRAFKCGLFQVLLTASNLSISIFLIVFLNWGENGRIWGISLSILVFSFYSLISLHKSNFVRFRFNRVYVDEALRWGIPLIPHVLGGLFLILADRFIITHHFGLEKLGIYYIAVQLAAPVLILGSSFNSAFRPWLYEKLENKKNETAVFASYISIISFLIVGAIYSVLVYLVFPIVVGDKYDEALQFVIVLILANTFQSLYYTVSNYILFEGKTMVLSTMTILIGLIYAITGWYTVSSHGLSILPYVLASISIAYFFLIWIISNRINPKPWFNFNKLLPEAQKFFPNLSTYSK